MDEGFTASSWLYLDTGTFIRCIKIVSNHGWALDWQYPFHLVWREPTVNSDLIHYRRTTASNEKTNASISRGLLRHFCIYSALIFCPLERDPCEPWRPSGEDCPVKDLQSVSERKHSALNKLGARSRPAGLEAIIPNWGFFCFGGEMKWNEDVEMRGESPTGGEREKYRAVCQEGKRVLEK